MSPFVWIVRILMRRVSDFSDGSGKMILHHTRHSERKRLPERVEREVVHYIVHTHISRKPCVEIEHMRQLAVALWLRDLHFLILYRDRSLISLCLCCGDFLLFHTLCDRISVQAVKSYFPVKQVIDRCAEYMFSHKCLGRIIKRTAVCAVGVVSRTISRGGLLTEVSVLRVKMIQFVHSCPVTSEDQLVPI